MKPQPTILMLLAAASAFGCVSRGAYNEKLDELGRTKSQLKNVSAIAQDYSAQLAALDEEKNRLSQQNSMLRSNNDEATRRIDDLMRRLEDMETSQIPGVETHREAGAFTYRVDGGFLFDPGKAELKPTGRKTIEDVAKLLQQHDYKIEVAGHTDTDPVDRTKERFPRGNIELGAERALSVWSALADAGVPANRMRVASYAEYVPVDPADKSRNRRVEIRVLLAEPGDAN